MFDSPLEGEFTQGTVFSCAYAENYPVAGVLGLVITARCDAAQDKVPVFSYIPVVSMHRWMLLDGASVLLDRVEADLMNTIGNALRDFSLSESLLKSYELSDIYRAHFEKFEADRSKKTKCEKLKAVIDNVAECRYLMERRDDEGRLKVFLSRFEEKVTAVVRDVTENKLSGYYLLRGLNSLQENDGADFVALLREVHHIPTNIAKMMARGAHREAFVGLNSQCPAFCDDDDFSMAIAKLRSPWIEHLMQNFTLLFARIGVKSNDYREVKKSLQKIGIGV
ncbi:hypothetical protein [Burkholderia ubonensis]|uniref:hypothetical protein n=1 Tax=Burkholderia ubonensis TaxID=101571 RepID=UPI0009B385E7|nr:hypothetical protein [Burkholderia ubonensis]